MAEGFLCSFLDVSKDCLYFLLDGVLSGKLSTIFVLGFLSLLTFLILCYNNDYLQYNTPLGYLFSPKKIDGFKGSDKEINRFTNISSLPQCPNPNCIRCLNSNSKFDQNKLTLALEDYYASNNKNRESIGDYSPYLDDNSMSDSTFSERTLHLKVRHQKQFSDNSSDAIAGIDVTNLTVSQPTVMFVPQIPTQCIFENPLEELGIARGVITHQAFDRMQTECHAVSTTGKNDRLWVQNSTPSGSWRLFYFYNQGKRIEENCSLCPHTTDLIENVLARHGAMIDCPFGNAMFSLLNPGTHIAPHTGSTNVKLRCHLTLADDDQATMRVGDATVCWKRNEIVLFDDSFPHEVIHQGTKERVVLLVDFWHPQLREEERRALNHAIKTTLA